MKRITLHNGLEMPQEGLGLFRVKPKETQSVVQQALQAGYRMIDTAMIYGNEAAAGRAVAAAGIPREDVFITSKVWVQDAGYEETKAAFAASLEKLGMNYIDLYLIHQPLGDYYGSWRAMEELYREGKIRAIGVSNFSADRLLDLVLNTDIKPMVNQIELHPFFQQKELLSLMKQYGIQAQAWGPLAEGQKNIFHHPDLQKIAQKHGKTIAQVVLRWHAEQGHVFIPKTVHPERMAENRDIWDFQLDEEDKTIIAGLDMAVSEIIDLRNLAVVKTLNTLKFAE